MCYKAQGIEHFLLLSMKVAMLAILVAANAQVKCGSLTSKDDCEGVGSWCIWCSLDYQAPKCCACPVGKTCSCHTSSCGDPGPVTLHSFSNFPTDFAMTESATKGGTGGGLTPYSVQKASLVDVNGDGLPDYVVNYNVEGGLDGATSMQRTYLNNGCDWVDTTTFGNSTKSYPKLKMCTPQSEYALMDEQVAGFLNSIGLAHYIHVFEAHEVDHETLLVLSDDQLKEIGIRAVGARAKIMSAISSRKYHFD
jgi:hypothetical protein